jgi:hypothetical protein
MKRALPAVLAVLVLSGCGGGGGGTKPPVVEPATMTLPRMDAEAEFTYQVNVSGDRGSGTGYVSMLVGPSYQVDGYGNGYYPVGGSLTTGSYIISQYRYLSQGENYTLRCHGDRDMRTGVERMVTSGGGYYTVLRCPVVQGDTYAQNVTYNNGQSEKRSTTVAAKDGDSYRVETVITRGTVTETITSYYRADYPLAYREVQRYQDKTITYLMQ